MNMTFDLPEDLLRDVEALAGERHMSTAALVEEGLRRSLEEHRRADATRLGSSSYKGAGALSAVFENAAGNEARGDDSYLGDDR